MGFVKGMDVSMAKALEAHGASYYLDGKQDDLFRILKKCGTDMIRLRIWPDPYEQRDGSASGLSVQRFLGRPREADQAKGVEISHWKRA